MGIEQGGLLVLGINHPSNPSNPSNYGEHSTRLNDTPAAIHQQDGIQAMLLKALACGQSSHTGNRYRMTRKVFGEFFGQVLTTDAAGRGSFRSWFPRQPTRLGWIGARRPRRRSSH